MSVTFVKKIKDIASFAQDPRMKRLILFNLFNAVGFVILNGGLRLGVFPYLSRLMGPQPPARMMRWRT
jgi:hypothetical protein